MEKKYKKPIIIFSVFIFLLVCVLPGFLLFTKLFIWFGLSPEMREAVKKNRTEKIYFKVVPKSENENAGKISETETSTPEPVKNAPAVVEKRTIEVGHDPSKFVPFSDETSRLAKEFYSNTSKDDLRESLILWEKIQDENTTDTQALQMELKTRFSRIENIVNSYINTVDRPDYNTELWGEDPDAKKNDWLECGYDRDLYTGNKLLEIRAYFQIKEKKFSDALDTVETMMRAGRLNDFSGSATRWRMENIFLGSCTICSWIIDDCDSSETLSYTFNRIKGFEKYSKFEKPKISPDIIELIEPIRAADRLGIKTNIEGLTRQELWGKSLQARADYAEQVYANTPDANSNADTIKTMRYVSVIFGGKAKNPLQTAIKAASPFARDFVYTRWLMPKDMDVQTKRFESGKGYYNLLLISAAIKLYEVQNGYYPDSLENLAGTYLDKIPEDNFKNYISQDNPDVNYGWKYSNGKISPTGWEHVNNGGNILYEMRPSTTNGDIYFKKMKK